MRLFPLKSRIFKDSQEKFRYAYPLQSTLQAGTYLLHLLNRRQISLMTSMSIENVIIQKVL
jgi:hypothetical protein